MLNSIVHFEPSDVDAQLLELGLNQTVLTQAAYEGYQARANATKNHPPLYAPFVAWGDAVKALRDGLIPLGWRKCNANNWPRVIHPEEKLAITVATGNQDTGQVSTSPYTSSPKGSSTINAMEINRLMSAWLPGFEPNETEDETVAPDKKLPSAKVT